VKLALQPVDHSPPIPNYQGVAWLAIFVTTARKLDLPGQGKRVGENRAGQLGLYGSRAVATGDGRRIASTR